MTITTSARTLSLVAFILSAASGCSDEQMEPLNDPESKQAEILSIDRHPQPPRQVDHLGTEEDPALVRAAMASRMLRLARETDKTKNGNLDKGRQLLGATADGLKLTYHYQLEPGTSISRVFSEYSAADIASICESPIHKDDLLRGAIYAFRYSTGKSQSEVRVAQGDCE